MMKPGSIYTVTGSSQSGKTVWTKEQLKKFKRYLVWDPDGQYPGTYVRTRSQLLAAIKKIKSGNAKLVYCSNNLDDFGYFCQAAFTWGAIGGAANKPTLVVAEETADVTNPGKAPQDWGVLIRRGKKRGISIIAITQRPSESDKTALGNADYAHCCRLAFAPDREYVAKKVLDCPANELSVLKCDQTTKKFDFIQRDLGRDVVKKGQLSFSGNRPSFKNKLF